MTVSTPGHRRHPHRSGGGDQARVPLRDRCDTVWAVVCRPEDAIERLAGRGMSAAEVRRRMANQMPLDEMADAADVVIDGSAGLAQTTSQVERALADLERPSEADAIGG